MLIRQALLVLATAAGLSACASADVTDITQSDTFAARAASSDQFEVKSAELALNAISSPDLRHIAQRMIDDHMKSSQELMSTLAAEHKDEPDPAMLPYQQRLLTDLQNSDHFDCDYLRGQEVAHMQAISLFDTYITYGDDANLKSFAAQTLPVIEQHLQMIEDTKNGVHGCGFWRKAAFSGPMLSYGGHICGTGDKKHFHHHRRHHHHHIQTNNNQ